MPLELQFKNLPNDILREIAKKLDIVSKANLSVVDKKLLSLAILKPKNSREADALRKQGTADVNKLKAELKAVEQRIVNWLQDAQALRTENIKYKIELQEKLQKLNDFVKKMQAATETFKKEEKKAK